jgi:hypothetical protein
VAEEGKIYQVVVEYYDPRAGSWSSPSEAGDAARSRYATEANRMHRGGIRGVYLLRHGVVVALSKREEG